MLGEGIAAAGKATWRSMSLLAAAVAKLACKAAALFLDRIVAGVLRGLLEMGKWAVYTGGKLAAKALSSAFNLQAITYTTSIQKLLRADVGTFEITAVVLGAKLDLSLGLALLRWADGDGLAAEPCV